MGGIPSSWQTVTIHFGLGVAFAIPHDWNSGFSGGIAQSTAPASGAFFRVLGSKTSTSLAQIGKGFAASELRSLRKQDPKAAVSVSSARLSVGPAAKVTMRYRGTWVNRRTEITRVIYFVKNGNHAYELDFGAPSATANQTLFSTIANTFRFLGVPGAA
jgi:hypothetical protein